MGKSPSDKTAQKGANVMLLALGAFLAMLLMFTCLSSTEIAFGEDLVIQAARYKITYENCSTPTQYVNGSTAILAGKPTAPSGKAFVHWATTPDGCLSYGAGETIPISSDVTLYAVWGSKCETCDGSGEKERTVERACTTCNSTGIIWSTSSCSSCLGLGGKFKTQVTKCPKCWGGTWGIIVPNCSRCGGKGTISQTEWTQCSTCRGTGTITTTKTCTTCKGTKRITETRTGTCTKCAGSGIASVPAVKHNAVVDIEPVRPTCITEGRTEAAHCSECGTTLSESTVLPARGHSLQKRAAVKPSCTKGGSLEYYLCTTCNSCFSDSSGTHQIEQSSVYVDAVGHSLVHVVAVPPTCTASGNIEHWRCSSCNELFGDPAGLSNISTSVVIFLPATGHRVPEWSVSREPTCTESGHEVGTCSECGELQTRAIAATGHSWSDSYEVVQAATCTEAGYECILCTVCGEQDEAWTRVIDELGHAYDEWETVREPTCTETGFRRRTCSECGETQVEAIAATGHIWSDSYEVVRAATCTEAGYECILCTVCGEQDEAWTRVIDELGHAYDEWETVREPTCTETGSRRRVCSKCGNVLSEEISPLGHDYLTIITSPTWEQAGFTSHVCSRCGDSYETDYVLPLGITTDGNKAELADAPASILEDSAPALDAEQVAPEPESTPALMPDAAYSSMHRLYNPYTGEHFYTANASERDNLTSLGWQYEGEGWKAPLAGAPVYRLYNPNAGDHHYTSDAAERDVLVNAGWNDEGVGWNTADASGVPLYREYNPNAATGTHNYTQSPSEHSWLCSIGWQDEGVGWYGV